MRRLLIALGLLLALSGALVCLPLVRTVLTHEQGYAKVLEVFRDPRPDGQVSLRPVWEIEVAPGRWLLCDVQHNQFFRRIEDPVLPASRAEWVAQRVLPDRQNRQILVHAFWRANDPEGTAFIIDISRSHPWRRYILGLVICGVGLILARIAWGSRRWKDTI